MITEKTCEYWIKGAADIKRDFPDRILIGSIMAGYSKEDWEELVGLASKAGFDALELNLSCPHGMNEKGMGRACGEDPDMVREITKWAVGSTHLPVIIKITPNYGEAEALA